MTDNIKELANLQVVLLGVTETNVLLQTESGKGVKTLTSADLSGGGGTTVATTDNIVMQDTDGTLFFKRVSTDTPPVLTNWKLSDGSAYTITGTPVPYGVTSVEVTGTVTANTGLTQGLTDVQLRASPVITALPTNAATEAGLTNLATMLADISIEQSVVLVLGQVLATSNVVTVSSAVSAATRRIVLTATVDTWVNVGDNPTSGIGQAPSILLVAGVPSYPIKVNSSVTKVSAISTLAGVLSIAESN